MSKGSFRDLRVLGVFETTSFQHFKRRTSDHSARHVLEGVGCVRGTTIADVVGGFGKTLQSRVSGENDFKRSREVNNLSVFLSHSWEADAWKKYIALLLHFNTLPCVVIVVILILVGTNLCYLKFGDADTSINFYCARIASYFLVPLLLVWHYIERASGCCARMVFFDKNCVNPDDAGSKALGIRALDLPSGSCGTRGTFLVAWDRTYMQRLWCAFEILTWYVHNESAQGNDFIFLPIERSNVVMGLLCGWGVAETFNAFFREANDMDENFQDFMLFVYILASVVIALIQWEFMFDISKLKSQLHDFSVQDCSCQCLRGQTDDNDKMAESDSDFQESQSHSFPESQSHSFPDHSHDMMSFAESADGEFTGSRMSLGEDMLSFEGNEESEKEELNADLALIYEVITQLFKDRSSELDPLADFDCVMTGKLGEFLKLQAEMASLIPYKYVVAASVFAGARFLDLIRSGHIICTPRPSLIRTQIYAFHIIFFRNPLIIGVMLFSIRFFLQMHLSAKSKVKSVFTLCVAIAGAPIAVHTVAHSYCYWDRQVVIRATNHCVVIVWMCLSGTAIALIFSTRVTNYMTWCLRSSHSMGSSVHSSPSQSPGSTFHNTIELAERRVRSYSITKKRSGTPKSAHEADESFEESQQSTISVTGFREELLRDIQSAAVKDIQLAANLHRI